MHNNVHPLFQRDGIPVRAGSQRPSSGFIATFEGEKLAERFVPPPHARSAPYIQNTEAE